MKTNPFSDPNIQFRKVLLVLILLSNLTFNGCKNPESLNWKEVLEFIHKEFPDVHHLSTQDLADWLADKSRKSPLIFDTRENDEYTVSHLPNAQYLNLKSDFKLELKGINQNAPIVVYCSVGYRSSTAARKLKKLGYTQVHNLEGSIFKWVNEGRTVVANHEPALKVHPYDRNWGQLLEKKYHP